MPPTIDPRPTVESTSLSLRERARVRGSRVTRRLATDSVQIEEFEIHGKKA
jgi:hypothetical protein